MKIKKAVSWVVVFLILISPRLVFGQGGGWSVGNVAGFGLPESTILGIVISVTEWVLYVVGFAAVISFAISGILYLTSAGQDKQIEQAKNGMKYSIIGTIVAISGLVAIMFADNLLNANPF